MCSSCTDAVDGNFEPESLYSMLDVTGSSWNFKPSIPSTRNMTMTELQRPVAGNQLQVPVYLIW